MCGEAHEVEAGVSDIDGYFADGLGAVTVEGDGFVAADGGDLLDGEDNAGFVVGPHDGDESDGVVDGVGEFLEIEGAEVIDGDFDDGVTIESEMAAEFACCGVFDGGGDDFAAWGAGGEQAAEGGIDGFGAAGGEGEFSWGGTDESGDLIFGVVDGLTAELAEAMGAGRISIEMGEIGEHGVESFGSEGGGGVIVEVDGVHWREIIGRRRRMDMGR